MDKRRRRRVRLALALAFVAPGLVWIGNQPVADRGVATPVMRAGEDSAVRAGAVRRPLMPRLPTTRRQASEAIRDIVPLAFRAYEKPSASGAAYSARGGSYDVSVDPTGVSLELQSGTGEPTTLRMGLVGADPASRPTALGPVATRLSDIHGSDGRDHGSDADARWTDIPQYAGVRYTGAYPGVDVVYRGSGGRLAYDFVVAPGADPDRIRLAFEGAERIQIREKELALATATGEVRHRQLYAYQHVAGRRREVAARFARRGAGVVGFELGAYDVTLPLVIDPTVVYNAFLGSGTAAVTDLVLDAAGNVYAVGAEAGDAFVAKITPSGVVYSVRFGGSGGDIAYGIAVDSAGNAYVAGSTTSSDFPVVNAFQPTPGGGFSDGFVATIDPGGQLTYSTFLGGSSFDEILALELRGSTVFLAGATVSANFPLRNAFQTVLNGGRDAFVSTLNLTTNDLVYSTFLGGSGFDNASSLDVDAAGNVYVAGSTQSGDLPGPKPGFATYSGLGDGFVAKLNADGSAVVYTAYLGGSSMDFLSSVVVDRMGNAYVTGGTSSTNFPRRSPAVQDVKAGGMDAIVAKLDPTGSSLVYGTYLGGNGFDAGFDIALDACGRAYVTGDTESPDFPTVLHQQQYSGGFDAFIAQVSSRGMELGFSTYWGTPNTERGWAIAVDDRCLGNAYLAANLSSDTDATRYGWVVDLNMATDLDSDGIPDLIEAEESTDPVVKDNQIFTIARLFAMQQYRDFLGREGDPAGIGAWTGALERGSLSRAQVIERFFESAEFQRGTAPIVRLYFAFFRRIPDYNGLLNWLRHFRAGASLASIAQEFARSTEFQRTYGDLDNAGFVRLVYRNVLGRDPDPQGFDYWMAKLEAGMTRGEMMIGFSESPEYKTRSRNWVYVTQMYVGMLRRSPERQGFDTWVNYLARGNSGLALIQGFLDAPEYENRFLP